MHVCQFWAAVTANILYAIARLLRGHACAFFLEHSPSLCVGPGSTWVILERSKCWVSALCAVVAEAFCQLADQRMV